MCSYPDVVGFAVADGVHHDQGVAAVEAAGDVGDIDHGEELEVGSEGPVAVLFTIVNQTIPIQLLKDKEGKSYSFPQVNIN